MIKSTIIILTLIYSLDSLAFSAKVISILDGDSIIVSHENIEKTIRLRQIDTPEHKQPYGNKAKKALSDMIFGEYVEVKGRKKDSYNRILGTIFLNNENINLKMIRKGHAWAYRRYVTDKKYIQAEKLAKKDKLGLWELPKEQIIPPWKWRRANP